MQRQRRVVILGFSYVGKTAISIRFCTDQFLDEYRPTYENSFRRVIRHRGQDIDVIITDTQGQDEQELFRNEYCLGAHAYVLVFSLTSPRSLQNVKVINDKLVNLVGHKSFARVLVGSKQDLDTERRIPVQECMELAREWGCAYIECSAKQNLNVDEVFRLSLQEIDRFSDEDISTAPWWKPWMPLCRPVSRPSPETTLSILASICLLWGISIMSMSFSIWWGAMLGSFGNSTAVQCYGFVGVGLLTIFSSILGLIGSRTMRRGYIQTFAWSIWVPILSVLVGLAFTTIVSWKVAIPAVIAGGIEIAASIVAWRLQRDLRHVLPDNFDNYASIPSEMYA